jgi:hypothetical protein
MGGRAFGEYSCQVGLLLAHVSAELSDWQYSMHLSDHGHAEAELHLFLDETTSVWRRLEPERAACVHARGSASST